MSKNAIRIEHNWRWVDKTYCLKETSYQGSQTTDLDFIVDNHEIQFRENGEFFKLNSIALPDYKQATHLGAGSIATNGTTDIGSTTTETIPSAPDLNEFISVTMLVFVNPQVNYRKETSKAFTVNQEYLTSPLA